MSLVLIPQTEASVLVDASPSPYDRVQPSPAGAHLGFGLVRPFQRNLVSDFATSGSLPLIKACVGQILGMRGSGAVSQGELEWDPARGSLLYLLRHKGSDRTLQELARVYVADALRRYEPRLVLLGTRISREPGPEGPDNVLAIRLLYDVLAAPPPTSAVLFSRINQTVTLPQAA